MSFCHAVAEGEVETVRALLARGEDPNKKEEGSPPLEWAMSLLSSGSPHVNGPDLVRDVFACVELCLDAGADPNILCGPYSSKPVLLFRIIGRECGIDTRS